MAVASINFAFTFCTLKKRSYAQTSRPPVMNQTITTEPSAPSASAWW
jgi:hypothetical protein